MSKWKLVPVEPTMEMVWKGAEGDVAAFGEHAGNIYKAMIAAAPDAPEVQAEPVAWRQFLSDVITASGLLSHGKTDKGLAKRIADYAFDAMTNPPADMAAPPGYRLQPLAEFDAFQQVSNQADMDRKLAEALRAYMGAGFGESTDFFLQGIAYDMAIEALAEYGKKGGVS